MPRQKSTHVDDAAAAGRRLREARRRAGLSQRALAFPGCSPAYISRVEAGDRIASLQLLRELARRLGVTEEYLALGVEGSLRGRVEVALVEGDLALRLDDVALARNLFTQALEEASTADERARALAGLGQLAFREGEPAPAIELLKQSLEVSRRPDTEQPALADTLGRAYAMLGDSDEAIALFRRCLTAAEQAGNPIEQIRFSVLLANALIDSGASGGAEEHLGNALALAHGSRDPFVRARLYWSQARLREMQKDLEGAARYARMAVELLELTEHTSYTAKAHHLLAHIELDRGRPNEALELLARGKELFAGTGNDVERAQFALEEARAFAQLGERERAAGLALEAAGIFTGVEPMDAGRGYSLAAEMAAELGQRERAIELFELAIEVQDGAPTRYLLEAYRSLAGLLEAEGKVERAFMVLKEAMSIQAEVGRVLG